MNTRLFFRRYVDLFTLLRAETDADEDPGRGSRLFHGGIALFGFMALTVVALLGDPAWTETAVNAMLPLSLTALAIGVAVTLTGHPRFWLLYLVSPPTLVIVFLCGLGSLTPIGPVLGWGVGMPLFLSVLLSDAGAVWVHTRTHSRERKRQRLRSGGPSAELPPLILWERVRRVRLVAAAGCGLLAATILLLFPHDPLILITLFALLTGAAGCLGLHATFLSWVSQWPLVEHDEERGEWQTTYVGRTALVLPPRRVYQAIASDRSPMEASAVLLTLLKQSGVGPMVRRVVGGLASQQPHRLILYLSLQAGGAGAIRYLWPALPEVLHRTAERYAALADEAAKPLDLQRWIAVLVDEPDRNTLKASGSDPDVAEVLGHVRRALLSYEYASVLDVAADELRQLVRMLYGVHGPTPLEDHPPRDLVASQNNSTGLHPLSWPVTLLIHVESHRMMLL